MAPKQPTLVPVICGTSLARRTGGAGSKRPGTVPRRLFRLPPTEVCFRQKSFRAASSLGRFPPRTFERESQG
ncbi:hypothetical protein NDU88_011292 [Pleurodeles waltl]|uniref:Uncharacterized protein n=1 Tax=Pleurodeles waltl TaxID=8319 RepID=A0AAV7R0J2_PLEWA|nr:hypothetical protein NDU88_011292 [Pleurodeles waltl]